jgi:hypothetical protein
VQTLFGSTGAGADNLKMANYPEGYQRERIGYFVTSWSGVRIVKFY